ncbi:TatD family hydrolase [Thiomicrospira aerophila AL3]|uniref:TatD family hydrolase n=1 Tax=Thiomicrospira aerophila AL3 TaxID=717772 RepID=W0DU26_9GAMM|nr:TatD family hydrolase [Thiomicrospira aerophila]AHF00499.1 TatD family hydrolase [Thiomicrospira aerophila AL3]
MLLFDSHAHLDSISYPKSVDISNVIAVAVDLKTSLYFSYYSSLNQHLKVYPFVGLHPWFIERNFESDLNSLRQLIIESGVSIYGIGEIGLDYSRNANNKIDQQACFEAQVAMAVEFSLPVSVHCVKAFNDLYSILRPSRVKGVIHSFPLRQHEAKRFVSLGLKLGLNPRILSSNLTKRHAFYQQFPLSVWVVESDFPNLNHHNVCNDPRLGMLALIKDLALAYRISDEEVAVQIYNTTQQLLMSH